MAARLCYALGIGLNVAGIATVLGLNWEGFISFSGFGYYSLFLYLGFLAVGALAWGAGLLLRRERWLDLMFWAPAATMLALFVIYPLRFYVD